MSQSREQMQAEMCPDCAKPKATGAHSAPFIHDDSFCNCYDKDKQLFDTRSGAARASDGQETEERLVGRVLEDRYEILQLIGRGGMGCVYLAEDKNSKQRLAVKTLDPQSVTLSNWLRLEKERTAAGILDHPGLLKIYASGLVDNFRPYLVMELIEGQTLADRVKERGFLPVEEAVPIFLQVCVALGYAHSKGVVHRDIKTDNIMLTGGDSGSSEGVKVVDFGIVKLPSMDGSAGGGLTKVGQVVGTPLYMSPEQCAGEPTDARADIYSLGCVMYEALTGFPPFRGEIASIVMVQHQNAKPLSLKEASPGNDFPEAVEKIVSRMLEKDPSGRYQTMYDVADDLSRFQSGRPLNPPEKSVSADRSRRNKIAIALSVIASCMAVSAAAGYYVGVLNHDRGADAPPTVSAEGLAETPGQQPRPVPPISPLFEPAQQTAGYFSTISKDGLRIFHFPQRSIGRWSENFDDKYPGYKHGKGHWNALKHASGEAIGNVYLGAFNPIAFTAGPEIGAFPSLLGKFRSDELDSLGFNLNPPNRMRGVYRHGSMPTLLETDLRNIERLTSLKTLDIHGQHALTDRCLQSIYPLTNLVELETQGTSITPSGLAALPQLLKLQTVCISSEADVLPFLKGLEGSKNLNYLYLAVPAMTKDDWKALAKIPGLQWFDCYPSGKGAIVLDDDVFSILSSSKIQGMKLVGSFAKVTDAHLQLLKKMPQLTNVELTNQDDLGDSWGVSETQLLRKALPGRYVSAQGFRQ